METITFMSSYLTFYIKGEIKAEENFMKFKIPNSILGFIPLGAHNKSIAINQISSVDNDFRLLFKNLLIGIVEVIIGLACLAAGIIGIIILALGALTILNSFQTVLTVTMTSGQALYLPFVIFEKAKAQEAEEAINKMISGRMDDTNNRKQTDRIVDAIDKK